jgi:hypothetical protein
VIETTFLKRCCLLFVGTCRIVRPMTNDVSRPRRSALLSFQFLGTALIGSLTMALISALAPPEAQLAVLGSLVSILGGLFLSFVEQDEQREHRRNEAVAALSVPITLASEPEFYDQYLALSGGLTVLSRQDDAILREIALLKLASLSGQVESLAEGLVVFHATETWRAVYDKLLRCPDITEYFSVAWVRSQEYWRDPPGRQSMRVNFEAVGRGMFIDRIVILRDELWPRGQRWPVSGIMPWIRVQHEHGIRVRLVRESDLASEPGLLLDLGVYGSRALGVQELDERSRTLRFTLDFNSLAVRLAKDRWMRLALYTTSFASLLGQPDGVV